MPPDQWRALRERVAEQARLEQAGDVPGLCSLILPAYRASAESVSRSAESFQEFVGSVRSAELVGFEIEQWQVAAERFGGASAALVRSQIRYNGSLEPSEFRTIWVLVDGAWHTTAVGKLGDAEQRYDL